MTEQNKVYTIKETTTVEQTPIKQDGVTGFEMNVTKNEKTVENHASSIIYTHPVYGPLTNETLDLLLNTLAIIQSDAEKKEPWESDKSTKINKERFNKMNTYL